MTQAITDFSVLISVGTLMKREIWRFMKVWNQTILAPVITTLLFLAVMNLALGGNARNIGGMGYAEYIAPGLIMMAVVQNAFANTSSSLILSKIQGVIIDLLMPPFTGGEITFALVMGGVARGVLVAVSVSAAVYCFIPLNPYSLLLGLLYLVLASVFLALCGCLAGIISPSFDMLSAITNYVITPLAFLSGTFYSIQNLPDFWRELCFYDPLFYMIDGFRYALTGHHEGNITTGITLLLVCDMILWLVVRRCFVTGWKLRG